MAESRTSAPSSREEIPDRDGRIEHLLLAGLDHYFAGDYERAISVWTRVLFLDRGHARARAYIERARSAVAERQRESEELLHRGVAAFNRGESVSARRLLNSAVETGGTQEVALAFLQRLDRLEQPSAPSEPAATRRRRRAPRRVTSQQGRVRLRWGLPVAIALGLTLAGGYFLLTSPASPGRSWLAQPGDAARVPADEAGFRRVPVPRPGELALARARELYAQGHLREALDLLAEVPVANPLRSESEQLRGDVQRALILGPPGAGTVPSPAAPPGATR